MEAIFEFLADVLGEAAIEALAPVFLAAMWAAGTFCLFYLWTRGSTAGAVAAVGFLIGLGLTYLRSAGAKWARNILGWGALLALVPIIALFVKSLRPH